MIVDLTADEAFAAGSVALVQQIRSVLRSRTGDHGSVSVRGQRERWADSIHGLLAEFALAKALGICWTPGGISVSRGDVQNRIEIRATEYTTGHLLIYKEDPDEAPFVLMVGHFPQFRVAGWICGEEGKQQQFWRSDKDPPCYWIPQSELQPIDEMERS